MSSLGSSAASLKSPARLERARADFRESDANCIDIGLINNMPTRALEATERQFRAHLDAASDGMIVRLTLYALPDVFRSDAGQRHVSSSYSDINELWHNHLDGLIVTGTEPRALSLQDETYWGSLTRLLEWAEENTHSAVWSCLAAHAAVLYIDGIGRRPLRDKRFGVFDCAKVSDHPLTVAVPSRFQMPHSRWNEIPEDALARCGYRVLTRSADAGADAFVKQRKSLFVFFQGHPEYEADTLLREYRRDVGRFLSGERQSYPSPPQGYFDESTVAALSAFRERALSGGLAGLPASFPTALLVNKVRNTWRSPAVGIYRNWLLYLRARKEQRLRIRQRRREYQARVVTWGPPQEARARQTPGTREILLPRNAAA